MVSFRLHRHRQSVRWLVWGFAAGLLLLPALAMRLTEEVTWNAADFLRAGLAGLVFGATYEWGRRAPFGRAYRGAVALSIVACLGLTMANGAVGLVGAADAPANRLFMAVPVVVVLGTLLSRLRPGGMAFTMAATALAQIGVGAALLADQPEHAGEALGVTAIFTAIWIFALFLFWRSGRRVRPYGS